MAVGQSHMCWLTLPHREQAPSHSGMSLLVEFAFIHQASASPMNMLLDVEPSARAVSLG